MNTTHIRKKLVKLSLGAALAAAAAPAVLLVGAGTAQAYTPVSTTTDALGVTVHIESISIQKHDADGVEFFDVSSGLCTYTAVPVNVPPGVLPPLPVYNLPFYLQERGSHDLWFPGIQTGTTWDVTVKCPTGTNSPTTQLTY